MATYPVVVGGSALIASGLIAVTPAAPPPDLPSAANAPVRLLSGDGSLLGDLFGDGSILNIPYNLFANTLNLPYNEMLALQEVAYALGPPGTTGGVPGWLPPGATVENGQVDPVTDQYTLGGTGSWWSQSLGNTWGWDDGNWPQVAGYPMLILPIPSFTEHMAYQVQNLAQYEFTDGAHVGCEFECSDVLGYLGGWFHTPITGTYPTVLQGTIEDPTTTDVIWSGQPAPPINFLEPFTSLWNELTSSPADNPIHPFNLGDFLSALQGALQAMDNAWVEPALEPGSFVYWGADTMYSIPAVIGGLIHSFTLGLVPNEFSFLPGAGGPPDQLLGAEPVWGPDAGPSHLPQGLLNGAEYVLHGGDGQHGLLGYLDPSTWSANFNTLFDPSTASADLSTALDPSTWSTDLSGLLGPDLAAMLTSLF